MTGLTRAWLPANQAGTSFVSELACMPRETLGLDMKLVVEDIRDALCSLRTFNLASLAQQRGF